MFLWDIEKNKCYEMGKDNLKGREKIELRHWVISLSGRQFPSARGFLLHV